LISGTLSVVMFEESQRHEGRLQVCIASGWHPCCATLAKDPVSSGILVASAGNNRVVAVGNADKLVDNKGSRFYSGPMLLLSNMDEALSSCPILLRSSTEEALLSCL